jgi:MFS family permease
MKYAKTRLSLLMFIQFFIWGATGPILSLYLLDCLGFTGTQVGLILGLSAVSGIVSPALMAFVADRVISSERLLSLLNAVAGICMIIFSRQTEFYPALFACVAFHSAMNPSVPLINAITFHHAPADRRKFGNIRVWGTIGWIAVAWTFSFMIPRGGGSGGASTLPLLLKISAVTSFVMAVYSLTIPKGVGADNNRRAGASKPQFFPIDSFRVMMKPQVLMLSLIAASVIFIDKFYSIGTAPFLRQIGFGEGSIMPAMSLGQVPEIAAMAVLGWMLKRCGFKAVMLAGMAMVIFRYSVYASVPEARWIVYAGLSVHGLAYTFTQVTALISLDGFCGERDRAGAHQLYGVVTGGVGGFLGSYAAGRIADLFAGPGGIVNYGAYWTVPLALSAVLFEVILVWWPKERGAG